MGARRAREQRQAEREQAGEFERQVALGRAGQRAPWLPFEIAMFPNLEQHGFNECWLNPRYQVLVRYLSPPMKGWPTMIHLSIKAVDKSPVHDWRDLQRLKNELCGTDSEAVVTATSEADAIEQLAAELKDTQGIKELKVISITKLNVQDRNVIVLSDGE